MNLFDGMPGLSFLSVVGDTTAEPDDVPQTVQDLLAAYGWRTDNRDLEGLLRLFEEQATLESPKTRTTVQGRAAISRLITGAWAQVPPDDRRRHLISGVRVFGEVDQCLLFHATFALVGTPKEGVPAVYATGYYQGTACASESALRFRYLKVSID